GRPLPLEPHPVRPRGDAGTPPAGGARRGAPPRAGHRRRPAGPAPWRACAGRGEPGCAAGGPRALAVHPRAAARAGLRRRGARSRRLPARRAPGARGQAGVSVRLFAGLPLDTGTRATLANLTADVRRTEWPVRWVAPEA